MLFWLPSLGHNAYLEVFTTRVPEEVKSADFAFYNHVYPDAYTYHFERQEFLENLREQITNNRLALMKEIDRIRELKNMGIREISFFDRIRAGLMLGSRHIFRFFSLEDIGGPFILLLILLGFYNLKQKNKYLFQFFIYWIPSVIFLLAFVILAGRNHLMDFNWVLALLVSLGLLSLGRIIVNYLRIEEKKSFIVYIVILLTVLYNFVLASHVAWSRIYDNSSNLTVEAYSQEIKKLNIKDEDVIAVNLDLAGLYNLNYLTNKSVVLFKPKTIKNLLEKDRLNFAFEKFGVKYILGYPRELSEEIVSRTKVINIASQSLKPAIPEMSRNKGWLMNLIK